MLFKHKKFLVTVSSAESGKEVAMEQGAEASRNKVDAQPRQSKSPECQGNLLLSGCNLEAAPLH